MPHGQATAVRREDALRDLQHGVRRLEIETEWIKAELARLDGDGAPSQSLICVSPSARSVELRRRSARPLVVSLIFHGALLAAFLALSFAAPLPNALTLLVDAADVEEPPPVELVEVEFAATEIHDASLRPVLFEQALVELDDVALPASTTGASTPLASISTDVGTLMAEARSGTPASTEVPFGAAEFFGTRSRGERFVFVIDNSSSMRDGRFEAAIGELTRSIDAMSRRQSFYVIFVSDRVYPMFYPEPAADLLPTARANKRRLGAWMRGVELRSGRNRELITAMDVAASLRPHAVFLLWDGDLKYSDAVRHDVMTHLTRANQWNFTIHTLGMGALSAASEENLAAIAAANGGIYRRVEVAPEE